MYPRPFSYVRAESVEHAVSVLAEHGPDAAVLAGGCSLIPLMKYRLAAPEVLLDIGRLTNELRFVEGDAERVRIGALISHAEAARNPATSAQPLLARVASRIADVQVRNMGTVVGGVCSLAPISDWVAPLLALGGSVLVRSGSGQREIPSSEFVVGPYQSALSEEELATEVRFPASQPRSAASYRKLTVRANDAVANCCVSLTLDGQGAISAAGVAFGSINPAPFRSPLAEQALIGDRPTEDVLENAAQVALANVAGFEDAGGDAEFRRKAGAGLFKQAVRDAYQRANSGGDS